MATTAEESSDVCKGTPPENPDGAADLRGLANVTPTASPPNSTASAAQASTRASTRQAHDKFAEILSSTLAAAQKSWMTLHDRALELAREQALAMQCLELEVIDLTERNEKFRQRLVTLGEEVEEPSNKGDDTPSANHGQEGKWMATDNNLSVASTRYPYDATKSSDIALPGMVDWDGDFASKENSEKGGRSSVKSSRTIQMSTSQSDLKESIRRRVTSKKIETANFYKVGSVFATMARSSAFEKITLLVVTINAIWIGVDTDWNDSDFLLHSHWVFIVAENAFCVAFCVEWIIRFIAFEKKVNMLKDNWYVFDTFLVTIMVIETWLMPLIVVAAGADGAGGSNAGVLRIVRLFRLTRMARMARVLRAMPELIIMIKALKAATRSVFFTLVLLGMLLYVFGVTFAQLCDDSEIGEEMFSGVMHAMYSLLLYGVLCLDFLGEIAEKMNKVSFYVPILLFIFVLLSALTVMNMLIGVLCEVVNTVAKSENENNLIETTRSRVMKVLISLDEDGNAMLSKDEFLQILEHPKACKAFQEVGIDVVGLVDYANTLFWDQIAQREVELSFEDFMDRVLKLRDSNVSTVKDILHLARIIHTSDVRLAEIFEIVSKDFLHRPSVYPGSHPYSPVKGEIGLPQDGPRHLELGDVQKIE